MQLSAKSLLEERFERQLILRKEIDKQPGIALIWVGDDPQTAAFVRAKQVMAKKLDCQFFLHQFKKVNQQQLEAVIDGLNGRKDIHGIVLQLPLPKDADTEALIQRIVFEKDIDNLRGDSPYLEPTPNGIISLMLYSRYDIKSLKTVILGDGRLVGRPLASMYKQNNWNYSQINADAQNRAEEIQKADILISCTGVKDLIVPSMVSEKMIVIDGSGIDVDVDKIEPLVKFITPKKGAIGPLTVSFLFENLLKSASSDSSLKKKA